MLENKHKYFISEDAVWEGDLYNFVNRGDGIKQHGKDVQEIKIDGNIITLTNKFFTLDGKQSSYVGIAHFKIEGDKLISLDEMDIDPSTKNKIENYVFNGYITHNHIYIFEAYDEVMSESNIEHRRNDSHYYFISEDEMLNVVNVYVNNELLVFGSSHLKRKIENKK